MHYVSLGDYFAFGQTKTRETLQQKQTEGVPRFHKNTTLTYHCALFSGSPHGTTRHH